jgi:hypothetical protein
MSATETDDSAYLGTSVSVSLDGSLVMAGAPDHDRGGLLGQGAAFVFEEPTDGWDSLAPGTSQTETAILSSSSPVASQHLGHALAMSDDASVVAVGAPQYDDSGVDVGAVFIYHKDGDWSGTITEDQIITVTNAQHDCDFGSSLSLSAQGGYLLMGARRLDLGYTDDGYAYLYTYDGATYAWSADFNESATMMNAAYYGSSLAISPDASVLAIAAPQWDSTTHGQVGTVFLYQ